MVYRPRLRAGIAALAATILGLTVLASPAQAAAPAKPTSLTVTRSASGGYQLSWPTVSGATGYTVYRQTPVRQEQSGHGWLVVGSTWTTVATLGKVTSYRTSDLLTSEVNATYASGQFAVAARNASGTSAKRAGIAGCASGYFISARGSNQNPTSPSTNPSAYASGLGSRGLAVYEDARKRLGLTRSQFQANMVNYPAVNPANWRSLDLSSYYGTSVTIGTNDTSNQVNRIIGACPSARIVLFGYSQGGQVVGNAFQGLSTAAKKRVTQVHLFADARRNSADAGIFHRPIMAAGDNGIAGKRTTFTGLTDKLQVNSWCWSADDICSWDKVGLTVHGSAYDCYEDWVAHHIAARAKNKGWRSAASTTQPTCSMKI